jgi:hypothetical protein
MHILVPTLLMEIMLCNHFTISPFHHFSSFRHVRLLHQCKDRLRCHRLSLYVPRAPRPSDAATDSPDAITISLNAKGEPNDGRERLLGTF